MDVQRESQGLSIKAKIFYAPDANVCHDSFVFQPAAASERLGLQRTLEISWQSASFSYITSQSPINQAENVSQNLILLSSQTRKFPAMETSTALTQSMHYKQ